MASTKHPLPWLTEILNGVEHANFFEQRATEYSKGATKGDWHGEDGVWTKFRQSHLQPLAGRPDPRGVGRSPSQIKKPRSQRSGVFCALSGRSFEARLWLAPQDEGEIRRPLPSS
jgi:hypothetical protein